MNALRRRRRNQGAKTRRARRRIVIRRDGEKCAHCGATEDLTIDHIVPTSRGGGLGVKNLQLLCFDCNQAKADDLAVPA